MVNPIVVLDYRRIIKINNSMMITLPKIWTKNKGLDAGDSIEVILLDDSSLRLLPHRRDGSDKEIQ